MLFFDVLESRARTANSFREVGPNREALPSDRQFLAKIYTTRGDLRDQRETSFARRMELGDRGLHLFHRAIVTLVFFRGCQALSSSQASGRLAHGIDALGQGG